MADIAGPVRGLCRGGRARHAGVQLFQEVFEIVAWAAVAEIHRVVQASVAGSAAIQSN